MKHAMQKLQEAAKKFGPLCVGLDTDPSYIPENIIKNYSSAPEAVLAYNLALIERIKKDQSACCFKIQVAYYEAMGLKGMEVYAKTVKAVRDAGFVAISDIKRGDIAATAGAYARAHFTGDFETDIITINPYMGFDTLKPFTEYTTAEKGSKAMFVLLRTSNPGMIDIEQQELKDGGRVLDRVGNELNNILQESKKEYADETCSPVGAVVGCTEESDARSLRDAYPEIFFLIPGYGAQGGAAKICGILLEKCGGTVNSSRGILCAWKKDPTLEEKRSAGTLTMEDLINASAKAAIDSKTELMSF
ncbi:MAG: orotidine-5'-phosphate decarboxylase [Treponema sp.]|uniref:orotidine-5'-phosphate decarboxylase n=1 Tax=Treponema sp. TaxID=166 RepID=UPI00298E81D2|nr:orotidine-5'-phosphate decarboxylase [Treponema sp.]MDD5810784.1 orotidine-5'-phosphate decarboxylase [Treponema sp.]